MRTSFRTAVSLVGLLCLAGVGAGLFLLPGLRVVADLRDPALHTGGITQSTRRWHAELTPRIEAWARARITSGAAAGVALHDVPTTEWPLFTSVFYLMATDNLEAAWKDHPEPGQVEPLEAARGAVSAARDLLIDPVHHTWVKTHWGPDYLHREDVFFRSLLIAGLTSYERLTGDGTAVPMLRDQVETLSSALDASPLGVLHDYPGECYPIDVVAAIGFIRRADAVLDTDHRSFVARSLRGFVGPMADAHGLVPYLMDGDTGQQLGPSRGVGNSWVSVFAPDLWPEQAQDWYSRYEASFWQERLWADGFRELARGTLRSEWMFDVDAGLVLDGFGTAATAFGIAAARRNGRLDHAYAMQAEAVAASWPLPNGTLLIPRLFSNGVDAPYLGEASLLYMQTVTPAPGVSVVTGGHAPALVWICLAIYFGVAIFIFTDVLVRGRKLLRRPRVQPASVIDKALTPHASGA